MVNFVYSRYLAIAVLHFVSGQTGFEPLVLFLCIMPVCLCTEVPLPAFSSVLYQIESLSG